MTIKEKEILDDNNINNENFALNSNNENTKEELKKLFLEEIFLQKYTAPNYEINENFFNEIIMPPFGNCFYCCLSYYIYKNKNDYPKIREIVFQYIIENPENFYIFFRK